MSIKRIAIFCHLFYNKEKFLSRALDSLLLQDAPKCLYEVLAVNDGSTDGSAVILGEYSKRYKHLRVITQNNQGLSIARNNGLLAAKGDYVWYVDADDSVSPHSVKNLCKAIATCPDVIPIYARTEGVDRVCNQVDPRAKSGQEILLGSNWSHCGVFWIMRREFLLHNNLRFFPSIYHEDTEFTPRMLYFAKSVIVVPEILYIVYRDPNSITQIPRPKRAFDCLLVAERLCTFIDMIGNVSLLGIKFDKNNNESLQPFGISLSQLLLGLYSQSSVPQ